MTLVHGARLVGSVQLSTEADSQSSLIVYFMLTGALESSKFNFVEHYNAQQHVYNKTNGRTEMNQSQV